MPVAILGESVLDVTQIDPASVRLQGVSPLTSALGDVATPFVPYTGKTQTSDCNTSGPDGFPDLTLAFGNQTVARALGAVIDGQVIVLSLTGNLKSEFGGVPFRGEDVVVVIRNK
jgi:hypothetical protein